MKCWLYASVNRMSPIQRTGGHTYPDAMLTVW